MARAFPGDDLHLVPVHELIHEIQARGWDVEIWKTGEERPLPLIATLPDISTIEEPKP